MGSESASLHEKDDRNLPLAHLNLPLLASELSDWGEVPPYST